MSPITVWKSPPSALHSFSITASIFQDQLQAVSPDSESRFHFTSSALHEKHKLYTTLKLIRKKKSRKPARNNVDCSSNFYREETLAVLFCWGAP